MSDWVKRKFTWLEAVVGDDTLRGWLPLAVAVRLAAYYLNAGTQDAWPAIDTLARDLGVAPRSLQRALALLVAAGKLGIERGGRGPGDSNRYRMENTFMGDVRATLKGKKGDKQRQKRVTNSAKKGDTGCHPNPRDRTREEPGSAARAFPPDFVLGQEPGQADAVGRVDFRPKAAGQQRSSKVGRRNKARAKTDFPEGWVCNNAELAIGQTVAGWDLPTAEFQFRKFRLWYREKGITCADWSAAWEKWCLTGLEREAQQRQNQATQPTGLQSLALGANKWAEERKRRETKH